MKIKTCATQIMWHLIIIPFMNSNKNLKKPHEWQKFWKEAQPVYKKKDSWEEIVTSFSLENSLFSFFILFLEYVYESINNNIMKNDFIYLLFSVVLDKRLGWFLWKKLTQIKLIPKILNPCKVEHKSYKKQTQKL